MEFLGQAIYPLRRGRHWLPGPLRGRRVLAPLKVLCPTPLVADIELLDGQQQRLLKRLRSDAPLRVSDLPDPDSGRQQSVLVQRAEEPAPQWNRFPARWGTGYGSCNQTEGSQDPERRP